VADTCGLGMDIKIVGRSMTAILDDGVEYALERCD
jgi:hypothetical protein